MPALFQKLQSLIDNHEDDTVKRVAANAIEQISLANGTSGSLPSGEILYFQEAPPLLP